MKPPVRVAVTGAAGQISYALLFRIASGDMLGHDQPVILQLLEIPPAMEALQGTVMEIEDGAFPLVHDIVASDEPEVAFGDADFAMLVGARPRGPGMERKDLLTENARIFSVQGAAIDAVARRDIRAQYPDIRHALILGSPATELVDDAWIVDNFIPTVQQRGAAIIKARGASSAASAASAAVDHMRTWAHGTPENDWVSMAIPSDGSYGINDELIYSYPVTCSDGHYEIVQALEIDEFSQARMSETEQELLEERDGVRDLL